MPSIKNLLKDAIEYDLAYLAHFIYFVLERGKIRIEDRSEKLMQIQLNASEENDFYKMYEEDILGMKKIQLYAVELNGNSRCYAFYFAETPNQVVDLHTRIYKWRPKRIHNVQRQLLNFDVYDQQTGKTESFKEMLERVVELPCYLLELKR
ncbi:hypothetical protein ACWV26_07750 [Rummeliibacillus sp. JY-2-4R]